MYFADGGKPVIMARDALSIFLHSLPEGSKFNIIPFGSSHEFLFPKAVEYNQQNLEKALHDISTYHERERCLGGTEIYQPLKAIFD